MFWSKKKDRHHAPQVTDASFNDFMAEVSGPVLIDFYAEWCGPCKILSPFLDELSEEYQGKAHVIKVNVDINPALVQHFKIKSMPTLLLISEGKVAERLASNLQGLHYPLYRCRKSIAAVVFVGNPG